MRGGSAVATLSVYRHIQEANSFQPKKKHRGHHFYRFVLLPAYWLYELSTRSELEEYALTKGHGVIDFTSESALKRYMPFRKYPLRFFVDSDEDGEKRVATCTATDHNTDSQGSADRKETAT